ncbi:bifunctional phosphoribosylaminoimidazolecarboxamide formyltransferase/IMP cyclohydrolase [Lutibacter sp.]|uniref:bifunctional phosphoribosylaminoimidazolecarboxamide formyltransferase/IMP cyclohydrolase n=1 Tax=Lutibacter sp. TaxID=1925666 RepID=UPI0027356D6F|nr:bifunctional phosphoribosylaminoimidazolecarboxamide formyltransferase/IMP cyclohydrolase [Lutibacter sp.]MDP3311735.1 bifunctional phosphoribosylaminoimidazolecarboxamide formyltransferase/IMP cyclohydrolase [Lutibacter sp.]
MDTFSKAKSALISVFHKDGLEPIIQQLNKLGVTLYSTGGTENFIKSLGIPVVAVENLTSYPSILGGRVKTLHPKVFGGILARRSNENDKYQLEQYEIPEIDIVIVDLYPFEKTLGGNATLEATIEKIDIGGISLIRGAAKNYNDVICVSSTDQYQEFLQIISDQNGATTLTQRKKFASYAFSISSHYDTAIFNYLNESDTCFRASFNNATTLRYGENPHQKGIFYGNLNELFDQLNGKELSYNNLLDVDAAVNLIGEFKNELPTFAILKHNNACGLAQRETLKNAYLDALSGDPTSAFGGVLISNQTIEKDTAEEINKLFCEVVIAPAYSMDALEILKSKKNRIILIQKEVKIPQTQFRTALNGVLWQDKDLITDSNNGMTYATTLQPSKNELEDLFFASKICKHTKSNTIVLVKDKQLCASGTGQTSRVDALNQAITKAINFNFNLQGAVMASDAFFPFPDCVEMAHKEGISAVIQPGGSIKDQLSIDYCNENKMSMIFTGTRHFKH